MAGPASDRHCYRLVGDTGWRPRPYAERRAELMRLLEDGLPALRAVPSTEDRGQALQWVGALAGVEGLVGKRTDALYAAGLASGWVKCASATPRRQ